jgi:hypothetical protein
MDMRDEERHEWVVANQWRDVLSNKFPGIQICPTKTQNSWGLRLQTTENESPTDVYNYCQRHSKLLKRGGVAPRDLYMGDKLALDRNRLREWADS